MPSRLASVIECRVWIEVPVAAWSALASVGARRISQEGVRMPRGGGGRPTASAKSPHVQPICRQIASSHESRASPSTGSRWIGRVRTASAIVLPVRSPVPAVTSLSPVAQHRHPLVPRCSCSSAATDTSSASARSKSRS